MTRDKGTGGGCQASQPTQRPSGTEDELAAEEPARTPRRVDEFPREVGVLLMVAGLTTGMMPPPPGPFDLSLVVAGGIVCWPRGLRGVEGWVRRRFPKAHRDGIKFLDRFAADLERRYPGASGCPAESRTPRLNPASTETG